LHVFNDADRTTSQFIINNSELFDILDDIIFIPYALIWSNSRWWPRVAVVSNNEMLEDAIRYTPMINGIFFEGQSSITIHRNFLVDWFNIMGRHEVIIPEGVLVVVRERVILGTWYSKLTVEGTLQGTGGAYIQMGNPNSELRLGDRHYLSNNRDASVDPDAYWHFPLNHARIFTWGFTGTSFEWSEPEIRDIFIDWNEYPEHINNIFATINNLEQINWLRENLPELRGISINGHAPDNPYDEAWNGISFTSDWTLSAVTADAAFADLGRQFYYVFAGNQFWGYGQDAYLVEPIVVESGVTVTFDTDSNVAILFQADTTDRLAIVGVDATSKVVIGPSADVVFGFNLSDFVGRWWPGTWYWEPDTSDSINGGVWVRQPN
jgi:hypothetical protein